MTNIPRSSGRLGLMFIGILALTFTGGAGIVSAAERFKPLSKKEVRYLLKNASTPLEHAKLSVYYEAKAEEHEAEAREHRALAELFALRPVMSSTKHPMGPLTPQHCRYYAEHCRKVALEMREKARIHRGMSETTVVK